MWRIAHETVKEINAKKQTRRKVPGPVLASNDGLLTQLLKIVHRMIKEVLVDQ